MSRALGAKWDLFTAAVLPVEAPATQRQEMRRAFYAGAEALRQILLEMPEAEPQAMQALDDLQAEFEAFGADVVGGAA